MTIIEELAPGDFSEALRARVAQLNAVIDLKLKALKCSPEGTLNISECRGNVQYYHRTTPDSTKGKYISKNNMTLARRLAQKDYDARLLKALKKEQKILKTALNELKGEQVQGLEISKIFQSLTSHRRALVTPVTLTDEQYAAAWLSKKYEGKSFPPDAPEYYTARGERVRSKSEVIIADTLNRLGVPYHYEYPITLKSGGRHTTSGDLSRKATSLTIYPDFLCLNLRTRQEFIWEHFGLMDDPAYSTKAVQKLQTYNQNDIHPGQSLIISTETADLPLNTKHIENIIQTYLK